MCPVLAELAALFVNACVCLCAYMLACALVYHKHIHSGMCCVCMCAHVCLNALIYRISLY